MHCDLLTLSTLDPDVEGNGPQSGCLGCVALAQIGAQALNFRLLIGISLHQCREHLSGPDHNPTW